MSQTIAFNADTRQKILVEVLAKRLGFKNTSDMLRTWIENGIAEHISIEEQGQILAFYKPKSVHASNGTPVVAGQKSEHPARPKAARSR